MAPSTDPRINVPAGFVPTGVDLFTGEIVWRQFVTFQHWVDKASTWMHDSYACFDVTGKRLLTGADFRGAEYPVTIAKPKDH